MNTKFPVSKYWRKKRSYSFVAKTNKSGVLLNVLEMKGQQVFTTDKSSRVSFLGSSSRDGYFTINSNSGLRLGSADDELRIDKGRLFVDPSSFVSLGDGADNVYIATSSAEDSLDLQGLFDLGGGNNRVSVFNIYQGIQLYGVKGMLVSGDGDDEIYAEITVSRSPGYGYGLHQPAPITLSTGASIQTGAGRDVITGVAGGSGGQGIYVGSAAFIDTGEGDDLITGDPITLYEGNIFTGGGDDVIDAVLKSSQRWGGNGKIDMGAGIDKLRLATNIYTVDVFGSGFLVRGALYAGVEVELYGVEFIASPDGDWRPLQAGRIELL